MRRMQKQQPAKSSRPSSQRRRWRCCVCDAVVVNLPEHLERRHFRRRDCTDVGTMFGAVNIQNGKYWNQYYL